MQSLHPRHADAEFGSRSVVPENRRIRRTTMRCVYVRDYGGPECLEIAERGPPTPGEGEVLIRTKFTAVNGLDVAQRRGAGAVPLPFVPGIEAVGIACDPGRVASGRTAPTTPNGLIGAILVPGTYAEFLVVPEHRLIPIPDHLGPDLAATLLLDGLASHYLVEDLGRVEPGERVLVHDAGWGIGRLLVQWCARRDARAVALVDTHTEASGAEASGASEVHVLQSTGDLHRLAARRFDATFDPLGRADLDRDIDLVRDHGRIVSLSAEADLRRSLRLSRVHARSIELRVGLLEHLVADPQRMRNRAWDVWNAVDEGWLDPAPPRIFGLADARDAHGVIEAGLRSSKVLLAA
jgi:NADPH2:quinone reductase